MDSISPIDRLIDDLPASAGEHAITQREAKLYNPVLSQTRNRAVGFSLGDFAAGTNQSVRKLSLTDAQREVAKLWEINARLRGHLRQLALDVTRAGEWERERLAELLHDDLQQLLVAAKIRIALLLRDREPDRQAVQGVELLIQQAIDTTRTLSADLHPPILHQSGLAATVQWLAQKTKRLFDVNVIAHMDPSDEPAEHNEKALLYQAIRELVFNAVKHAHAREIVIHGNIRGLTTLCITVEDNGIGFDPAQLSMKQMSHGCTGIFRISSRVAAFGGSVRIESTSHGGTTVSINFPLRRSVACESPPEASCGTSSDGMT